MRFGVSRFGARLAAVAAVLLITIFNLRLYQASRQTCSTEDRTGDLLSRFRGAAVDSFHGTRRDADISSSARGVATAGSLKIFVYPMPEEYTGALLNASRYTNPGRICVCCNVFYGSEILLHQNLLESPYVTADPEEADFFYVPAYVSCLIKTGARIEGVNLPDLRATAAFMERALDHIRSRYPYWDRRGGEDHIWAFTQGYGAHLFGDVSKIRRSIFLVTNGQYSEHVFQPWKDVVIPGIFRLTPVYMDSKGPAFSDRRVLAFWGGTLLNDTLYSSGIRQYVYEHFRNEPDFRFQVSQGKWGDVFTPMRDAIFCLCLEGWWAWTPRPYEAILSGCIPVLVSDDLEYPFERFVDWRTLSVKISPQRISELPAILRGISKESIASMQAALVRNWRAFHFTPRYEPGFATDMVLWELSRKAAVLRPAVGRGRRREYEEEWGAHEPAGEAPPMVGPARRRGTYSKSAPISFILAPKSQCDPTDPLKVRSPKARNRTHCHGAVRALSGGRTCTRPLNFSVGMMPNDRRLYAHPYERTFAIHAGAILSSEGAFLRSAEGHGARRRTITVAMQATVDRVFVNLPRFINAWQGPVSIAVLVGDSENDIEAVRTLVRGSPLLQRYVDVHFVQRHGHSSRDPTSFYPVNFLRNVAIQQVQTDWLMVLDVDVMPSSCMEAFMEQVEDADRQYARAYVEGDCPGLLAFIAPAVEFLGSNSTVLRELEARHRPGECTLVSKSDCVAALQDGRLRPMHMYFPPAYMPTDYIKWMGAAGPYEVAYTVRFEPYYVVRTGAPLFNDSFVDRGGNFAQQVFHMYAAGYRFVVLSDVFTIDIPHDVHQRAASAFRLPSTLWPEFVAYSATMYGVSPERGKAVGKEYDAYKAVLFKEVAKFPNTFYDAAVRKNILLTSARGITEEEGDKAKYTIIIAATGRTTILESSLRAYCQLPSLWGIVIVWNSNGGAPDPDDFVTQCPVPLYIRPQARDMPSNRYRPENLPPSAPNAVFIVDDDIVVDSQAIEFAFRAWLSQQDRIVGFIPLGVEKVSTSQWSCVERRPDDGQPYHMVLIGAAFLHKKHFDTYLRAPEAVRKLVDETRACDDIAMGFAVALQTQQPPTLVDGQVTRQSQETVASDSVRGSCVTQFVTVYGKSPLVPGDSILRSFAGSSTLP